MNELVNIKNNEQIISMTTVEIAGLTGKHHRHVMRDTAAMLTELYGEESLPKFGQCYKAENGQTYPCYILPKKEVLVLVSGYSIKLRMKIITRLEELEKRAQDPMYALNDPPTMRKLLLTYSEKVLELTPKAEAFDRFAGADGSVNIMTASKNLQVRPKELTAYLSQNGWIYKRPGGKNWLAYQDKIQRGFMEHKMTTILHGYNDDRTYTQALITPKGIATLAKIRIV